MKKYLVLSSAAFALVLFAGCGSTNTDTANQTTTNEVNQQQSEQKQAESVSNETNKEVVMYDCEGETVKAVFDNSEIPGKVTITVTGTEMTLPSVETGSGARYSDGKTIFWTHQGEASLTKGATKKEVNCVEKK